MFIRDITGKPFKIKNLFGAIAGMFVMIHISGCTKFVQIDPPTTEIAAATVYSSNNSAAAVMTGMYSNMMSGGFGLSDGSASIGYQNGMMADELTDYANDPVSIPFYTNSLSSFAGGASNNYYWTEIYNEIHVVNAVIEGLSSYSGTTPAIKQQLTGEAKFMRAFFHFYAVNCYGDVPLITTTNYLVNNTVHRTATTEVYDQIIRDLHDAQSLLTADFVDPTGASTSQRVRPNKGAATALLARAYLYTGNWAGADSAASAVIANTNSYVLDSSLNDVFLANSTEAIWQLSPTDQGYNTYDGYVFVLTSPPGSSGQFAVALSPFLLNAFESGDKRLANWVGVYTADSVSYYSYANKYKIGIYDPSNPTPTEYLMVLRLAEQYLIRAEARAQEKNFSGAQEDLDVIRTRAGLPPTTAGDLTSLITAIIRERQTELFTEWGHRWFDLIRTNNINSVMGAPGNVCQTKGGVWSPNWALMPLPLSELQANSNLTQNTGY